MKGLCNVELSVSKYDDYKIKAPLLQQENDLRKWVYAMFWIIVKKSELCQTELEGLTQKVVMNDIHTSMLKGLNCTVEISSNYDPINQKFHIQYSTSMIEIIQFLMYAITKEISEPLMREIKEEEKKAYFEYQATLEKQKDK